MADLQVALTCYFTFYNTRWPGSGLSYTCQATYE